MRHSRSIYQLQEPKCIAPTGVAPHWLIVWLTNWLAGWLTDWLIDCRVWPKLLLLFYQINALSPNFGRRGLLPVITNATEQSNNLGLLWLHLHILQDDSIRLTAEWKGPVQRFTYFKLSLCTLWPNSFSPSSFSPPSIPHCLIFCQFVRSTPPAPSSSRSMGRLAWQLPSSNFPNKELAQWSANSWCVHKIFGQIHFPKLLVSMGLHKLWN